MYHKMFCKLDVDSNLEKIEFEPVISESSKNVIILKNLLKLNKTVLKYSRKNYLSNSVYKIEDSNQYNINDQINKYGKDCENEDNNEKKRSEQINSLIFSTEVKNNQNYRDLFKYLLLQYKYLVSLSTQSKSFVNKKLSKSRIIQDYKKYQNLLKQLSNYENALQEIIINSINQLNSTTQPTIPKCKNYVSEEENSHDEIFLNKLKNCSLFNQSLLNNVSTNSNSISNTPDDNCVKNAVDNSKYAPLYGYLKDNEIDVISVYKKCNKLSRMILNEVKSRQKYNNYINLLVKCYKMKNELIESINQFNRDVVNFKAYFFDNINNVNYDIIDRVNKFHYSKYNIYYFLMSQISDSVPPRPININSINTINTVTNTNSTNSIKNTNTTNTIDSVVDTSESNANSVNSVNVIDSDNTDTRNSPILESNSELKINDPFEMEEPSTGTKLTPHFSDLGTTFVDSSPSRFPINTDDTSEDSTTNSAESSGTAKTDIHDEDAVESTENSDQNIEIAEASGKEENNRIVLRQMNGKLCKKLSKSTISALSDVNDYSNEYLSYAINMIDFTSKSIESSGSENSNNKVGDIKKYIGDNINHILHTISCFSTDSTLSSNPQLQTYSKSINTLRSKQFESFDDNILLYINNMYIISLLYGSNYYTNVASNSSEQGISARKVNRENSVESCDGKICGEDLSHVIIKSDKYICLHTGSGELIIPNDKMEDYVMSRLKLSGPIVHKVSCVLLGAVQIPGVLYITGDKLGFHSHFQRRFFLSKNNFHTIPFVDITDFSVDNDKLYVNTNSSEDGSLGVNSKLYTFTILDTNIETILHYINHYKNNSVEKSLKLNNTISAEYIVNHIVNNYKILYSAKTLVYNCNVNMDLFQFYNLALNNNNKNSLVSMSKVALGFTECQASNNSFIDPPLIINSIKSNLQRINSVDETQNENENNLISVKLRNGDIMKGFYTKNKMNYTIKNTNSKFFNKKITTCENLCYVFFNDVTIYQSVTAISNSPFSKFLYTVYTIIATSITPTDYSLDNLDSLISNSLSPQTTSNLIKTPENSGELSSENSKELDEDSDKHNQEDNGNLRMDNGNQSQLNGNESQVNGKQSQLNGNQSQDIDGKVNLGINCNPDEDFRNPNKDNQQKDNESLSKHNNQGLNENIVNRKSELNIKIYADVVFNKKLVFEKMIRNEANTKMAQATEVIAKELNKYKVSHSVQNTAVTNFEVNNQNNKLIFFVLLIIFMFYYYR